MQGLVVAAAAHRPLTHAALADDQADTGLLDECLLEFLHAHRGRRSDGDHLIVVLAALTDDWSCVQDGAVADIDRQLAPLFDDTAMRDIAARRELARQVNDIANMDILEIFCADWRREYFLSHQKSTSECESIV